MSVYYITNDSIDNFNITYKLKCVGIENKILTEEELKQQNKVELYKDTTTYENDNPFIGYPIRQDNTIRPAIRVELIKLDLIKLEEGEYLEGDEIIYIKYDESLGYFRPSWNKETHKWIESAGLEEQNIIYKNNINFFKSQILQNGFDFKGHQQKCREKDLALLGNAVSALDDMQTFSMVTEEHKINWSFNDNDIISMTETDLRKMRIAGANFINNVYKIEAELKASQPNNKLTIQEFKDKIDAISEVKCYQ